MISTEKAGMREFFKSRGFSVPDGMKISPGERGKPDIPLPVIVKPDFTHTGKKDIFFVSDERLFDRCVVAAAGSSQNRCAEIERFIEGIDVSCMFFANKGNVEILVFWDELVAVMKGGTISGLGISTPSVTCGTVAEEGMKRIACQFALLFPDVTSILVLSFRIDLQGKPHVIEVHADLTGDLILDSLLPASCEGFDPWTLVLEAATGGMVQFPETECIPTSLCYNSGKLGSNGEHVLIQKNSLATNLELFAQIMETNRMDIAHHPKHLSWLREFKDVKGASE
jgi:hypothetical protein